MPRAPEVEPAMRRWWIVVTGDGVDVCDVDPGDPPRVTVLSSLRTLTRLWRGDVDWATVLRSGELALHGDPQARRALPRWLPLTGLAGTPRPRPTAPVPV